VSTPDSIHTSLLLPVIPRLTVVPRPVSTRERINSAVNQLPPAVVVAAGLMAIQTVAFLAGRLLAVNLSYDVFIDSTETARAFGALSFLSIVVILGALILGHRSLITLASGDRVALLVTAITLAVAYLHLVLWFTRVLTAATAAASLQSSAMFMPSIFWWG
jgi:hypothetical protein